MFIIIKFLRNESKAREISNFSKHKYSYFCLKNNIYDFNVIKYKKKLNIFTQETCNWKKDSLSLILKCYLHNVKPNIF